MSRDSWVTRTLQRYSQTIYACHLCSVRYYTQIQFAWHLVVEEGERDRVLLRFLGVDTDVVSPERLNEACERAKATPRLS